LPSQNTQPSAYKEPILVATGLEVCKGLLYALFFQMGEGARPVGYESIALLDAAL
jgi:hypothetical protein